MKTSVWLLLLVGLALSAIMLSAATSLDASNMENAVMTVNGRKVTPQEFAIWRSAFSYSDLNFEQQMNEAAKLKLMQIIAQEREMIVEVDYEDVINVFEMQSQQQAIALSYGASPANELAYYSYIFENLKENLGNVLVDEGIIPATERNLIRFYDSNKDALAKTSDYVKAKCLYFANTKEGLAHLNNFAKKAENGEDLDKLLFEMPDGAHGSSFTETLALESESSYDKLKGQNSLLEALAVLPVKGWKVVKDDLDESKMIFIYCCDRRAGGFLPYEKVEEEVMDAFVSMQFDIYLEQRLEAAKIVANGEAQALTA
jgi:hypothetical protein